MTMEMYCYTMQYNFLYSNFGQNNAEIYDNDILLSIVYIILSEFGLKPRK